MKPAGEWNHLVVTCDKNLITVEVNGELVSADGPRPVDQPRTSGPTAPTTSSTSPSKIIPRSGYIGLQDHGGECWYKNIKLKPLAHSTDEPQRLQWALRFDCPPLHGSLPGIRPAHAALAHL